MLTNALQILTARAFNDFCVSSLLGTIFYSTIIGG